MMTNTINRRDGIIYSVLETNTEYMLAINDPMN